MRALETRCAAGRENPGARSMAVFFSFICASLLALLFFERSGFKNLPDTGGLLLGMSVLLLLTAAYAGSCCGRTCLLVVTALMGGVCAAGLCVVAKELKAGESGSFYLLPLLLLAVPLQFLISASGMKTAALLRRAVYESPWSYGVDFRAQNILMLLSVAASAVLTVCIVFR